MKEGRKPEHPEKTPDDGLQKMPHTKFSPKFQTSTETRTRTLALVAGKESRRSNRYTTRRPKWGRVENEHDKSC